MRLEAVTAELRPRSDWEAVDLGLALVRRDFRRSFGAWWLGMLPMLVPASLLLLTGHEGWFLFLFWWWIPVGSRMALHQLSRRLFGDHPTFRETLRELPRAVLRRFAYRMLWARLSYWRPLTMAVEDLEGLRRKAYSDRCRVLMRRGDSSLLMLGLWKLGLTFWLAVSLFCLIVLFLTESARSEWSLALQIHFNGGGLSLPASCEAAILVSVLLGMSLTDLFTTGAGFGIYVNHRTWIEGWDVELAFRRLAARIARVAVVLALFLILPSAAAGDEADKERIAEVLRDPDFEVHTEKQVTWVPADGWFNWNWGSGRSGGGGGMMDGLLTLMQVSLIAGIVALLAWLVYRYRHVFRRGGPGNGSRAVERARVVMGMEVGAGTLPEDIASSALRAWREGRAQEALGLLYRGSISWMIAEAGVGIAESDTESDCLRRVRESGLGQAGYFSRLTGIWMRMAYGRQLPGDPEVEGLCRDWPFRKGGRP